MSAPGQGAVLAPVLAPVLAMDLRCLQDENYRERGIGRHALALLRHARACSVFAAAHRVVAITDTALPTLPGSVRALVDRVQCDGYVPGMRGSRFVSPSPMTHAPNLVARLATGCLSAAAVHDFIPLDEPARYLPGAAARLDYHARLAALSWFRVFLPNSHATAARLRELLPGRADRVHVTGVGLDAGFASIPRMAPGMAPGGTEGRHVKYIRVSKKLKKS